MGELLRVLVYGSVDEGVCDSVRLGVYRDLLLDHGVELKTWGDLNDYQVHVPVEYAGRLDDAVRDGVAKVDLSPIEWADVLVFRRWYGTVHACDDCDFAAADEAGLGTHLRLSGHRAVTRDRIIRPLLDAIERDPAVLRGRAVVYELDDDLMSPEPWLGFYRRIQGDLDMIERFARRADLVTVTTPTLAGRMRRYNSAVRVIRNAVMPEWYEPAEGVANPRPLSLLYYGVASRWRDYAICRDAVDEASRATGARRIWLGSDDPVVRAAVDQALPYDPDVRGFIRRLVEARPAIGLAPVGQDDFSRSHSELHWLEYSLAGAATIASRTMGGGPYDVIRDGVDGLLARNKAEWRLGVRRLAASTTLREELAGRARERVLAEYDVRNRVAEWADAFRWAADHAGRGTLSGPTHGPGHGLSRAEIGVREQAFASEAPANLAHRRMSRARSVTERETLERLRGGRDVCWTEESTLDPLVTIRIPTFNRGRLAVERSIASALAQTYGNIEIVVVGDGATPETVDAVTSVRDPRLRFENLPRPTYPADPERRWQVAGTYATNHGLELARGAWIAPLDDDDEFTPDHVEVLLAVALEHRLELVYGQSLMEMSDGTWGLVGSWPPAQGAFCHGSVLYAADLKFFRYDPDAWRLNEPGDWNMWRRMLEAGVRMGRVEHVVYRHYAEARHRPDAGEQASEKSGEPLEAAS